MIFFYFIFFIFLSAPFSLFYNSKKYYNFVRQNILSMIDHSSESVENINFIKRNTHPGESIFILAYPNQAIYYGETNTRSIVDVPSVADVAFPREMNRIIDFLKNDRDVKIFVQLPLGSLDVYDPNIRQLLQERYTEVDRSIYGLVLFKVK